MPNAHNRGDSPRPRRISRRDFLKVAAAGLLAGCRPIQPPTATPTATPRPTDTPVPVPTPVADVRRPDVIKTYPDGPSKVVHAHHAGVWDGETLVPGAIRQMLDGSIIALTGLNDADEAWAALFAPDERIAIKVNAIYGTFDRPWDFHEGRIERAIAELNNLQPIQDRTRLIIGDALTVSTLSWRIGVTGDSIFMSFDPVAHDAAGLQLYCDVMTSEGRNPERARNRATPWLRNGAELGVGTDDPDRMDLVEMTLG